MKQTTQSWLITVAAAAVTNLLIVGSWWLSTHFSICRVK